MDWMQIAEQMNKMSQFYQKPTPSKRIPLGGFTKPIRKEKKDDLTYYTNY